MIRAIIVEDEDLSAKRLRRLLKGVKADIKVIKQLETVVDTIDFLRENKDEIDLIFLDIHLADGYSFEIFKQIEVNIPIVFTTAYDQYAL
jgi:two-component system response regulator LytT